LTFGISFIFIISIIIVFLIIPSFNQFGIVVVAHDHAASHISNRDNLQQPQPQPQPLHQKPQTKLLSSPHNQQITSSTTQSTPVTSDNQVIAPKVPTNPNKVVILTFGDGYQSQYIYAKPILDKYGYKGNFFVACNKVGTTNKMTWPELAQLYQEGNVIGSKTVDYGTKAMENKDLNHLSASKLEFEVGQSKQCFANNGINTSYFAVPMNIANNNATVINTIAKYYTLAINGHSNLMYLNCNEGRGEGIQNSRQTDCRTYFDNGTLNPENRYSVGEWSEQHIKNGNSYNDSQMFKKFVIEVNSQNKFNTNGIVNAIPLVAYHDIVLLPDVSISSEPSATTLNLFNAEMKYLHDNGFNVLTFFNLGYNDTNNVFYLKTQR
jgi:hypothetical protein